MQLPDFQAVPQNELRAYEECVVGGCLLLTFSLEGEVPPSYEPITVGEQGNRGRMPYSPLCATLLGFRTPQGS